MVIGGLMSTKNSNTDTGLPGASRVPVWGNLFKTVTKDNEVTETVIFIKATIIPSDNAPISDADKEEYKTFMHDPRPLVF